MKNIPVLTVRGKSLAEAYEKALIALYEDGIRFKTQYDKAEDPESVDATVNITVDEPWCDPMIHKAFPGGIEDLREYVIELLGYKDHWVKCMDDREDTRWEYTYHQRLADWGSWKEKGDSVDGEKSNGSPWKNTKTPAKRYGPPGFGINQIDHVVDKLAAQPYTRQAQMITWMPFIDFEVYDPPCLQSLWYRLLEDEGTYFLNCNVRFRSNDAWGANFMNMFGITHFNRLLIADPLQERFGRQVKIGRLNWHADSYHLYGKDQEEFIKRFWERLSAGAFEDRIFNFFDDSIQEIWIEAEGKVHQKIQEYDAGRE